MRILFTARALTIGGAERQLTLLARGLAGRGHAVALALFYPGGPLEAELAGSGVELHSLARRSRWDPSTLWRWPALVRAWRPDIVHGYLTVPNLAALTARWVGGAKIVWGVRASRMDLDRYDRVHRSSEALLRRLVRLPDLVVTNSRAAARDIRAWGREEGPIATIPNGIDTLRFRPDAEARSATRARLAIAEDALAVGIVGRLDPMKDHRTFLDAAARLASADARLVFVVAGDGPDRAAVAASIAAHGLSDRTRFIPARTDPERLYPALDLIVSSSAFGEGFSNVLAEAMACGVPAVATHVGDADLIVDDPAALVPPGDADALARAVAARLAAPVGDPRRAIVERFSVEALVSRTESVLLGLLDQPRVLARGSAARS